MCCYPSGPLPTFCYVNKKQPGFSRGQTLEQVKLVQIVSQPIASIPSSEPYK